jgi:hypothetical protein
MMSISALSQGSPSPSMLSKYKRVIREIEHPSPAFIPQGGNKLPQAGLMTWHHDPEVRVFGGDRVKWTACTMLLRRRSCGSTLLTVSSGERALMVEDPPSRSGTLLNVGARGDAFRLVERVGQKVSIRAKTRISCEAGWRWRTSCGFPLCPRWSCPEL